MFLVLATNQTTLYGGIIIITTFNLFILIVDGRGGPQQNCLLHNHHRP